MDDIIKKAASSSSYWGLQVKYPTKVYATTRVSARDRNILLPTIRTMPLKPMMMMINQKKTTQKMVSDLELGRMVNDGLVFRQNVYVRSYEVGPDQTTSIETIMNYLQVYLFIYVYSKFVIDIHVCMCMHALNYLTILNHIHRKHPLII